MPAKGSSGAGQPGTPTATATGASGQTLEIFKLLVEMADRVSQRRQANNNFYLSVNTAIVAASAYLASSLGAHHPASVISVAGIVICVAWGWSIQSYRTLNQAKFEVIHDVERLLEIQPFANEWQHLTEGTGSRHTPFHRVEVVVPWVFGSVHAFQLLAQVPWSTIILWPTAWKP